MHTTTASVLDSSLRTGHASIDDDHEDLLVLSRALAAAADDELRQGLRVLRSRFAEHFAEEDALMQPHDFSSRACHLDEHAAVLRSFDEVEAAAEQGDLQPIRRMATALAGWLPEHIDALDRQLAKFMFYRQTGGAPVLLRR